MKRIVIIFVTSLCAFGQKIETQQADRQRITRVATIQNHLTVLEFNEPVKEVAVGSSNFKVEWRENKSVRAATGGGRDHQSVRLDGVGAPEL